MHGYMMMHDTILLRREALYNPVWGRSCHVMSCDVTLLTCRQKIIVKVNIMGEISMSAKNNSESEYYGRETSKRSFSL